MNLINPHIRYATLEDFDDIHAMLESLENTQFPRPKLFRIYAHNLSITSHIYLVASFPGKCVGFLSCHCQLLLHHAALIGEIQEFIVHENFRNKGIGQLLLKKLEGETADRGVTQIEVTTNINRKAAQAFYRKTGFQPTHVKFVK